MVCIAETSNDQIARPYFVLPQFFEVLQRNVGDISILKARGPDVTQSNYACPLIGIMTACQRATERAIGDVSDESPEGKTRKPCVADDSHPVTSPSSS
jgi:hypothetical protein